MDVQGVAYTAKKAYFTEMGYDNIMVYIFGPLFGGISAGLFSHINEWA
jgi:hypothetical protein